MPSIRCAAPRRWPTSTSWREKGSAGTFGKCPEYFKARLESLLDFDIVGDVRGAGFMFAIESVADRETRALFPPEVEIGQRIAGHARRAGLIVRPGGHLTIFSPPLTMTRPDVEFLTETLRTSVRKTMDDLTREGLWRA